MQRTSTKAIVVFLLLSTILRLALPGASAQGAGGEDNLPRYWQIHAFLLTAGTVLFLSAYLSLWLKQLGKLEAVGIKISVAKQIARFWYKSHRNLASLGAVMIAAGLVWAFIMVQWAYGGPHLRLQHSLIGFATGIVASLPLLTGIVTRVIKKGKMKVRWWHVVLGFAGIVMTLIGLSSGWALE